MRLLFDPMLKFSSLLWCKCSSTRDLLLPTSKVIRLLFRRYKRVKLFKLDMSMLSRPLLKSDSWIREEGSMFFSTILILFSSSSSFLRFWHSFIHFGTYYISRLFSEISRRVLSSRDLNLLYFISFMVSILFVLGTKMLQTLFRVLSSSFDGLKIYVLYLIIFTVLFSSLKSLNYSIKILTFSSRIFVFNPASIKISSGIS